MYRHLTALHPFLKAPHHQERCLLVWFLVSGQGQGRFVWLTAAADPRSCFVQQAVRLPARLPACLPCSS
jgi:hypothetical protein